MVKIGNGEVKEIFITKSKLDLISTEEDPCVSDDTLIGADCKTKLASDLKPLLCINKPFFYLFKINFTHIS